VKHTIALGVTLVAIIASLAIVSTAVADTQYFPDGSGWGKTYRNNYRSSGCYDQYGSYSSCYQGTWAETFYYLDYLSVYETPQKWIPTLPGNYGGPFYWYQKSAIQNLGYSDISVSSDYDAYFNHRVDVGARTVNGDLDKLYYVDTYDE
jgi:hypothetical protein